MNAEVLTGMFDWNVNFKKFGGYETTKQSIQSSHKQNELIRVHLANYESEGKTQEMLLHNRSVCFFSKLIFHCYKLSAVDDVDS